MNDLAEKALHGAQAVGRHLARRPATPLAAVGFAAAAVVVVAGGRLGATADALPMTRWLDLLAPAGYDVTDDVPGAAMVLGIGALLTVWAATLFLSRRDRLSERQMWTLAGVWSLPFVIGPPLLSTDVYSSVAHGLLARHGLDPYRFSPVRLGHAKIVSAIDPTWRGTSSTAGPLGTLTEHLAVAVAGGNALLAVIVLRALAAASVVAIGVLAAELAGPRRVDAVALTSANPALLIYIVSGAHLDGVMLALLLGALVEVGRRRWLLGIVLAALAAGVKPIALVALPALIVAHAVGQRSRVSWRIVGNDLLAALLTLAAGVLVVDDGLGWARNFNDTIHEHTFWAPANLVSDLIAPVITSASYDDLAIGGRIAALLAAITAVAYLLGTVLHRPLERTIGYALLAIGLLSPVLYPWYLLWGVVFIAVSATGARRDWIVALSSVAAVLTPAGFGVRASQLVTTAGLVLIAASFGMRHLVRRGLAERPPVG